MRVVAQAFHFETHTLRPGDWPEGCEPAAGQADDAAPLTQKPPKTYAPAPFAGAYPDFAYKARKNKDAFHVKQYIYNKDTFVYKALTNKHRLLTFRAYVVLYMHIQ